MTYKTINFDLECYYLNYHLGVPNGVYDDYWLDTNEHRQIEWEAILIHNEFGIKGVNHFIKNISLWIGYSYDMDDLQQKQIDHLIKEFNGVESYYRHQIDGTFKINTFVEKDWEIKNLMIVEEGGVLYPRVLEINFMDKEIKVL